MLTHLRARCPKPMLDMQSSTHGRLRRSYEVQKDHAAGLTCLLQVLHLLQVADHIVANPAARHKSHLSGVNHMLEGRPKA